MLASCSLVANARTYQKKEKVDGKPKKVTYYGIQLSDSNIYTLKVRTPEKNSVPDKLINPTWSDINKVLGVTENSSAQTVKTKKSKKSKGDKE